MAQYLIVWYHSEMRYIPLIAIALYALVGFVPPKSFTVTQVKASAISILEHLDTAKQALAPVWEKAVKTEKNGDTRRLYHAVEHARVTNDAHACNNLEPIPLMENAPSLGDWIAFCLARVRSDADRCLQISDSIQPDLKKICQDEFGS